MQNIHCESIYKIYLNLKVYLYYVIVYKNHCETICRKIENFQNPNESRPGCAKTILRAIHWVCSERNTCAFRFAQNKIAQRNRLLFYLKDIFGASLKQAGRLLPLLSFLSIMSVSFDFLFPNRCLRNCVDLGSVPLLGRIGMPAALPLPVRAQLFFHELPFRLDKNPWKLHTNRWKTKRRKKDGRHLFCRGANMFARLSRKHWCRLFPISCS